MDHPATIADPRPRRAMNRVRRALEEELRGLLTRERADEILETATEIVLIEEPSDPARRLRALVGARLLDEIADLLTRVGDTMLIDETPTLTVDLEPAPDPIRLDEAIDEREGRARVARVWRHENAVARRNVG